MTSLEDGQQVRSMNLSSMALSSCLLMQDCKTVLVGSWDNNLYIYSTEYGRAVDERPIHDDAVTCLCWKENTLVTASWDSTVKMWSFECKYEGKKPIPPDLMGEMDHDTEVTAVDLFVNANEMQVASGTKDGNLFIWNVELLLPNSQSLIHTDTIYEVIYSPDGQRILSCSADQYMRVLDVNTGLEIYSKDVGEPIRCAAWDGQIVVAGGETGNLMVWDLVKIDCLLRTTLHDGPIRSLAVSKDCTTVVTGGSDGYLQVLSIEGS